MPFTLYPAIDLKDGACVRLLRGEMDAATIFNTEPANQAAAFHAIVSMPMSTFRLTAEPASMRRVRCPVCGRHRKADKPCPCGHDHRSG